MLVRVNNQDVGLEAAIIQRVRNSSLVERESAPTTPGNYEKRLPREQRGYYREYTVPTPGEASRGARRIIAGAQPPEVFYYTADHYRTFRRIRD